MICWKNHEKIYSSWSSALACEDMHKLRKQHPWHTLSELTWTKGYDESDHVPCISCICINDQNMQPLVFTDIHFSQTVWNFWNSWTCFIPVHQTFWLSGISGSIWGIRFLTLLTNCLSNCMHCFYTIPNRKLHRFNILPSLVEWQHNVYTTENVVVMRPSPHHSLLFKWNVSKSNVTCQRFHTRTNMWQKTRGKQRWQCKGPWMHKRWVWGEGKPRGGGGHGLVHMGMETYGCMDLGGWVARDIRSYAEVQQVGTAHVQASVITWSIISTPLTKNYGGRIYNTFMRSFSTNPKWRFASSPITPSSSTTWVTPDDKDWVLGADCKRFNTIIKLIHASAT